MKKIIKHLISQLPLLSISKGNRFIFCYHDVSDEKEEHHSPLYSTTKELFLKQVSFLNKQFKFVSLDKIINQSKLNPNKNYAAITFDDGFKSVLDNAWPIIKEYKMPITLFINKRAIEEDRLWVSDYVFMNKKGENAERFIELLGKYNNDFNDFDNNYKQRVYLNKEELYHLKGEGVSIQSHTLTHPVIARLSKEYLVEEINNNKNYIEKTFNSKAKHFAIPFGKKEHFNNVSLKSIFDKHLFAYTTNPNKIRNEKILYPRIVLTKESISELSFYINRAIMKKIKL
jgi:peptidoglycan/xylan/chitin deacetylase (PgdA/CDA1 family)